MRSGWKFVGEFRRGRKAVLALQCIIAIPDLKEAKAIANKRLVEADEITATKLSQAELKAVDFKAHESVHR